MFIIFLFIAFDYSEAINLNCYFSYDNYNRYTCSVNGTLITSSFDQNVTSTMGNHDYNSYNRDVTVLHSDNNTIKYMPRNIKKFFRNLQDSLPKLQAVI